MAAFETGNYRNLFLEAGKSQEEIDKKLQEIWETFFYGPEDERIYHPVGEDMGYLVDTGNIDARTEGMSYGMMICVQLDKKEEFDRIWKWACTYMWMDEGENEGLAFLSKYPICEEHFLNRDEKYAYSNALNIIVTINGIRISLTNVHLPWDSVKKQEEQIVAIDGFIHAQKNVDFYVLLGDFNGNMNSSVNRYLLGDQTINGHESNLYWYDLQSGYCVRKGMSLTPTLDFINNPRWAGKETITVPMVADRIYVMESWEDIDMKDLSVFGTEIYSDIEMTASDHYGIVAELEFAK